MKYVSIEDCIGLQLVAIHHNNSERLYLNFGDRYTRLSARDYYGSVEIDLHDDEPSIHFDGYELVMAGVITEAQHEAAKEARRRDEVAAQEARDRRAYELLKARFGE